MGKQANSFIKNLPYIIGYVSFIMIPICALTAIILFGNHLTGYIYNHITRVPILDDIIDFAILIIIFFICFYAIIFILNLMRKDKK
jgi:hypothetical protein